MKRRHVSVLSHVLPVREGLQTSLAASGNDDQIIVLQPTISTTAACLSLPDGAMDGDANEQRRDPAMPCHATYGAHHVFRQRQHTKKMEGEENDGQRPAT